MRDFKANRDINVDGDVIINDSSIQQNKTIIECNSEELEAEYAHREELLREERINKGKESFGFVKFAFFSALGVSIWYFYIGDTTLAMYIVGLLTVFFLLFTAHSISNETTEFEVRQLEVLKEIEYLLRERK